VRVAGIDGTKRGWVAVVLEADRIEAFGVGTIAEALDRLADAKAVAIDMPIGFATSAEAGGRLCEKAARAMLGRGRTSSVFSSPCRAALEAADYPAASAANRDSSPHRRGLSKQSHALFPMMREIDEVMHPSLQDRVFEVHPEVSFTELARLNGQTIEGGKKSFLGANQRVRLLKDAGISITPLLAQAKMLGASADDIIDAAVAAWTAQRRVSGLACRVPEFPNTDANGLRMEIWF
jgi:predicted RNase H-like nuclease